MKTKRIVVNSLILASVVLLQVFVGCQNPFDLSDYESSSRASAGTGFFTLNLGEVTLGRTILPKTPANVSDFNGFKLEFFLGGAVKKTVECPPANYSDPIALDVGSYELLVTAYLDAGRTKPAAQGSKTIEIKNGETTSAGVELAAITNAGQGTFKWTITYPASTNSASMKITPIAGTGGTEQTKTFTSGVADSLALNAGYYRVVFTLRNTAGDGAERWETLHIYQNMESAFDCAFVADQFRSYNTRVTNGNNTGTGSLRQAITDVLSGGTIVVDSSVTIIQLTSQLQIAATKNFVLEGNGVKIQAPSSTTLYFNSGAAVTIRRVHFNNTQGRVISNYGNLSLESCIFSNNANTESGGSIIISWAGATMNIKGSTFYKNSGDGSGAINMQGGSATLTGNLFYGNTGSKNYPIVYPYVVPTSGGYNVVDVPLGTSSGQSGWAAVGTDKVISGLPIVPDSFKLLSGRGAQNVIASRPSGYPTVDFYGNSIPASNVAAGAVQATASGYLVEVSVNDSTLGSAVLTSAPPPLTADGLYTGGGSVTVTFTATPKPGLADYGFQYWLVNDNQHYTANPLTLTLTDHYKAQAVFDRTSTSASVIRVLFTGTETTKTVPLNGLVNKNIYLVKVNTSGFVVSAGDTGGPPGSTPSIASGNVLPEPDDTPIIRMGHPLADEYHANPPPFEWKKPQSPDGPLGASSIPPSPTVGTTVPFYVESSYGNNNWVQKNATLRALGTYGNIWVMNDLTTFTTPQAEAMRDKFDLIYPIETSLFGNDFGGWNVGSKIQILVYDIGYNPAGTTLGYFWGKDMRTDTGSGERSNEAAMFYINGNASAQTGFGADQFYSTLVHEFQHMIHFSRKTQKGLSSQTWYNEMLSMLAEDIISPVIGVGPTNSGHPIQSRIPRFLNYYYLSGITDWGGANNNTIDSYATAYTFGAYLVRNYGGAALIREMLDNNYTNIASVTAALRTITGNSGLSFEEALRRYGEAMVFNPTTSSDVQSFNKTVTTTVNGQIYTATGFNVWGGFSPASPKIFGSNEQVAMRPYSLTVHQGGTAWKNQTGNVTITLQRPNDLNVEFYLMLK